MTKVNVYNEVGKKKEAVTLPKDITTDSNLPILAQAIRVFENRQHPGLARVKSRGEITSSKHKIYRQKGTGGARHGARSAPIFVGGGIAHGPTGNKRTLSLPSKMRVRALQVALGLKAEEGKLVIVDGLSKLAKTNEAQKMLNVIGKEENAGKNERFTIALSDKHKDSVRNLRNLKNVVLLPYRNLNAYAVFFGGIVVVDAEALEESENGKAKSEKVASAKTVEPKKAVVKKVLTKKNASKETTKV